MAVLLAVLATSVSAARIEGGYFAVIVTDLDASAAWYENTFRLQRGDRLSDDETYDILNLTGPGMFVELLALKEAVERPDGLVKGPFKVGVLVDDLPALAAGLPDDVKHDGVVRDEENRVLFLQLRDPDGNIVQVMQSIDDAAGTGDRRNLP